MVVAILLNSNLQLVDPEKPINPNKNVMKVTPNTIPNGCICNKLMTNLTISGDDTDIKNSTIQTKENINAQKLIFIFIAFLPV
jgi:hypothetical protein